MSERFFTTHKEVILRVALALAIFVAVLISFAVLADEIHEGDTLRVDRGILLWINAHASPTLNSFFLTVTNFGGPRFLVALALILTAYLLYKKRYLKTFLLVAAVGGAALLNLTLKLFFERARPELWQRLIEESNFSFPSGHAMGSSAMALAIAAILWNTKWRVLSIVLAVIYVLVIGISRLYLGVHYPSDVLGGWLVAGAWVLVVGTIVYTHLYRRRRAKGLSVKES